MNLFLSLEVRDLRFSLLRMNLNLMALNNQLRWIKLLYIQWKITKKKKKWKWPPKGLHPCECAKLDFIDLEWSTCHIFCSIQRCWLFQWCRCAMWGFQIDKHIKLFIAPSKYLQPKVRTQTSKHIIRKQLKHRLISIGFLQD